MRAGQRQPSGQARRWVAIPAPWPPATNGRRAASAPRPYTGPPSYPAPPRWGFPNVTWRWPTSLPGAEPAAHDPVHRQRVLGGRAVALLIVTAALAVIAGAAELWRYVLLLRSREAALNAGTVLSADALVVSSSVVLLLAAVAAIAASFLWLLRARAAVAVRYRVDPPRTPARIAAGVFVPGLNWVLAGPIVAELEHLASGRRPGDRPRPSRLVIAWWVAWVGNGLLLALTVIWRMRDGLQAQADGVLLTGLTNIAAVALAAITAVVVHRITNLIAPVTGDRLRKRWVADVRGAPAPELRPRRMPWVRR
ncbi:DUF4328 domain-containing protein [Haloechinothrix sp. LS1_15]|uniref:DUF4328 domain-containing protein n=1 Tax=Haloechinothrix sp. LS1_15 TaxID=2652248 RepID=UPI002944A118|nr:DUF4328 domain-containing protein [Haloechinothrix sp. LS1_15]MDV6014536.1 DUF4328 domain-containing protein [Haloechinothrix sp. LS1_15]